MFLRYSSLTNCITPGILKYQEDYDRAVTLPRDTFIEAAEKFLGVCNADTYVFINQPGLRKLDFLEFETEFVSLQRYIRRSSTAIKFEKVDLLPQDLYYDLAEFVKEYCNVDQVLNLRGNNTEDFQPFIDSEKRVIIIEYPKLPEDTNERKEAFRHYDKYLRTILAQIPSPEQNVIYTSLNPGTTLGHESIIPIQIFPDIFDIKSRVGEVEQNNRVLDVPRLSFNDYTPRFSEPPSEYVSIFDSQLIENNRGLLQLIFTILVGLVVPTFNDLPIPIHDSIKAVVLDKDNCIAFPHDDKIWPDYLQHWETLRSKYSNKALLIVSNTAGSNSDKDYSQAKLLEDKTGIPVLRHSTKKPGCHNEILDYFYRNKTITNPKEVAVVGDRLFTDILMANLMGSYGVWIRDGVKVSANPLSKFEKKLYNFLGF
ncbi:Integral membrane protein of the endoplasmic reticulum [Saccharomyces cerevisiae]|nr:BIG1p Integral membrane protein of the endoplasmic reticulum [Saccharomyces boulardii (nom. inval.)]KQC43474.1 Integral membrane protein of the endoplasmic reticulum [Saccharomyces boulardii (nom. inval.)]